MSSPIPALPDALGGFALTKHAVERMAKRSISRPAVAAALEFGRRVEIRGAQIFAIGRKEVARYRSEGIDLDDFEGTQVVVTETGAVMTAYRNRDFKGLRTHGRRGFKSLR